MATTTEGRVVADRYRLVRELGRGGMGAVWEARDELLAREVAVKEVLLPPGLTDEEQQLLCERTMREARSAARISHRNVVFLYDVVEEDGRPWLVMEFIPSRTLAQLLREDGPLSPTRAAEIGLDVLAALRVAHAAGVLHRDVKPGNVLIDPDGRIVLTDFGIATLEGEPSITRSGILVGAPGYIAPERALGEKAEPASDLWSLGATLYTAVEGHPPYERGGPMPTLFAVLHEEATPPVRAGPLWPVLAALLRREPAERLDAEQTEAMLRRVVEGETVLPAPRPAPLAAPPPDAPLPVAPPAGTAVVPPAPDVSPAASEPADAPPEPTDVEPTHVETAPTLVADVGAAGFGSPTPAKPVRRLPRAAVVALLAVAAAALLGWLGLALAGGDGDRAASLTAGRTPSASVTKRPVATTPVRTSGPVANAAQTRRPCRYGSTKAPGSHARKCRPSASRAPSPTPTHEPSPTGTRPATPKPHTSPTHP